MPKERLSVLLLIIIFSYGITQYKIFNKTLKRAVIMIIIVLVLTQYEEIFNLATRMFNIIWPAFASAMEKGVEKFSDLINFLTES